MKEKSFFLVLIILLFFLLIYLVYKRFKESFSFFKDFSRGPSSWPLPTPLKIPTIFGFGALNFLDSLKENIRKNFVLTSAGGKISKKMKPDISTRVYTRVLKNLRKPGLIKERFFKTSVQRGIFDFIPTFSEAIPSVLYNAIGSISEIQKNFFSSMKESFKPLVNKELLEKSTLTPLKKASKYLGGGVSVFSRGTRGILRKSGSYISSKFASFHTKRRRSYLGGKISSSIIKKLKSRKLKIRKYSFKK